MDLAQKARVKFAYAEFGYYVNFLKDKKN